MFRLEGLAPGEYRILAFRPLTPQELTEMDSATWERALASGKQVNIGPNGVLNVDMEVSELPVPSFR